MESTEAGSRSLHGHCRPDAVVVGISKPLFALPGGNKSRIPATEFYHDRTMLNEHDLDLLLRCRRLGHEVTFGYCRQETGGNPCRLILDCWWDKFDVRSFLRANLPDQAMAEIENARISPPPSKVLSLMELIQQAKEGLASENPCAENPPERAP
jgi:hypothetical protein